jgi:hypothetical protein
MFYKIFSLKIQNSEFRIQKQIEIEIEIEIHMQHAPCTMQDAKYRI